MPGAMASDPLSALLDSWDIHSRGEDRFEASCVERARPRAFGGELLAQGLVAAGRTVSGKTCRAFHAHFLSPADPTRPIEYRVRRLRDGRRFAQRQVSSWQDGRETSLMVASFASELDDPLDYQSDPMPRVPGPEGLASELDERLAVAGELPPEQRAWLLGPRAVEVRQARPVPLISPPAVPPTADTWLRATGPLPEDPLLHAAVLAYASDLTLLDIACQPRGIAWIDQRVEQASLDHAMWFHRAIKADDWLLYSQAAQRMAGGRALVQGRVFDGAGRLIATVAQEGLSHLASASD
jgi:acyl-CoA thioesterase II